MSPISEASNALFAAALAASSAGSMGSGSASRGNGNSNDMSPAIYVARETSLGRDAGQERGQLEPAAPYISDPGVVSSSPVSSQVFRPERIIGQPP